MKLNVFKPPPLPKLPIITRTYKKKKFKTKGKQIPPKIYEKYFSPQNIFIKGVLDYK